MLSLSSRLYTYKNLKYTEIKFYKRFMCYEVFVIYFIIKEVLLSLSDQGYRSFGH